MTLFFKSDEAESNQTQFNAMRFFWHRWYKPTDVGLWSPDARHGPFQKTDLNLAK
jgi:hypothetical protein